MKARWLAGISAIIAALTAVQSACGATVLAGAGRADITPDLQQLSTPLGGYAARRAKPAVAVHDRIYARALILSDGRTKEALVSVDLCFVPGCLQAMTARLAASRGVSGLDAGCLFLVATHSHTSPDPLAMDSSNRFHRAGWSSYEPRLLRFTAGRIADAIACADRNLAPVKLYAASGDIEGLNRNRRGAGVVDRAMHVLRVMRPNGGTLAVVIDFAAHPTIYGADMLSISADWPGAMCADIESALNSNSTCLFFNGAEGDAEPAGEQGATASDRVANYAQRISDQALKLLRRAKPLETRRTTIRMWRLPILLPARQPNGMFLLAAAQFGATILQAKQIVNDLMPVSARIAFLQIGPILLLGFPCEPSGELGLEAEQIAVKAGFDMPVVCALTNDWLAYALTAEQYRAGNYEAMMSFYGPGLGNAVLAAVRRGCRR
ncbi:MAG TPA: neutral/alkaline non-lysosomal ceramidase N-terminal domain-containing protein [Chthonomonadales bacterium]|nr:neutral/alkaline non-lysosomal ceramidase N-terminal domain-containing protein [Chthonomonadales bacterium]